MFPQSNKHFKRENFREEKKYTNISKRWVFFVVFVYTALWALLGPLITTTTNFCGKYIHV